MKKVFLTLALAAFAFAANAQLIIGGEIGFNTTGGNDKFEANAPANAYTVPNTKTSTFTFAPTISYALNDQMQVGVGLHYSLTSRKNFGAPAYMIEKEDWRKTSSNTYGITPYFRYYFANAGDFNFFCQATIGFSLSPRSNDQAYNNTVDPAIDTKTKGGMSTTTLGFYIVPGVNYRFSDHFSADIYIDLAGLTFERTSTKTYGAMTASGYDPDFLFDTDVQTTFGLTADASASDLNTHFANFRIGFNYHF